MSYYLVRNQGLCAPTLGPAALVLALLAVLPLWTCHQLAPSDAAANHDRRLLGVRSANTSTFCMGTCSKLVALSDEVSAVPEQDGQVLLPNSTGDGGGCLTFWDHIPTGVVVSRVLQQPTIADCCRACSDSPRCNVFAYCAQQAGCSAALSVGNVTSLPFQGCVLVEQGLSAPATGRPVVAANAPGFMGGAPITVTAFPIPGYDLYLAHGFFNRYDYPCEGSVADGTCMLRGTPQQHAPRCNADPLCAAMIYLPHGRDYLGPNLTDFKGGEGVSSLSASDATFNQNAAAFLKIVAPQPSAGSGLSTGAIIGIAIGACAGLAAVAAGVLLAMRWQRRRQGHGGGSLDPGGVEAGSSRPAGEALPTVPSNRQLHDSAQEASAAGTAAQKDRARVADAPPRPHRPLPWTTTIPVSLPSSGLPGPQQSTPSQGQQWAYSGSPFAAVAQQGFGSVDKAKSSGGGGSTGAAHGKDQQSGGVSRPSTTAPVTPSHYARGSSSGIEDEAAHVGRGSSGSDPRVGGTSDTHASSETSSSKAISSAATAEQLLSRLPEVHWQDWVVDLADIDFCTAPDGGFHELGAGSFGTVYKVILDGVQPYAAKVLLLSSESGMEDTFLQEASMLRRLRHRNIVGFRGVSISDGRGVLVMELMEGGDLFTRLTAVNKTTGERTFAWNNRGKKVALDVARGIHYLHSLHLTHFDIKASNVLLTRDLTAKIADHGFTKLMSNTHHSIKNSHVGTFAYMAPELLMGRPCTERVDIYSFGLLLWELCTGEHPVRGCNRDLSVPRDCPQGVADLYLECIAEEPAARPSARELVERLTKLAAPGATTSQ